VRKDGSPLAPSTKAKIRNLMSVLFNHAIRQEWLEQGRNPILLVRQTSGKESPRGWNPKNCAHFVGYVGGPQLGWSRSVSMTVRL
jgi:hypothetical protein